jgi:hypothetical protein
MIVLNSLQNEKDEIIKNKLLKSGMQRAIKIVRMEGSLTERGLDNDMKELMVVALREKPEIFKGYDLCMQAITDQKKKTLILYIGTFNPMG